MIIRHYDNYQMIGLKYSKVDKPFYDLYRGATWSHIGSRSFSLPSPVQYIPVAQPLQYIKLKSILGNLHYCSFYWDCWDFPGSCLVSYYL